MIQKDYHGEVDHERLGSKPGLAPGVELPQKKWV